MCLKNPYLKSAFVGPRFVWEMLDFHFQNRSFRILQPDLYDIYGNQDFFLSKNLDLGFPLGLYLSSIEVFFTFFDDKDSVVRLQPLMAIKNKDCRIELIVLRPLRRRPDLYIADDSDAPVSRDTFLEAIAPNLRRMTLKGYCVIVRFLGQTIFTSEEYKKSGAVSRIFYYS